MRDVIDLFVDLRSASSTQLLVRLVGLSGALLFLLANLFAGGMAWATWAIVLVLALLVALHPHALAPGIFIGFAIASWWATVEVTWHWALLPAAVGLFLVHTCAALSASVPAQAAIPASVLRSWAARAGLVCAVTVVIWVAAGLLDLRSGGRLGTIPGIVGLAVLATGLMAYLRWRARPGIPT